MSLHRAAVALRRAAVPLLVSIVAAFLVGAAVSALRPDVYQAQALVDVRLLVDEDAFSTSEKADRTIANELVLAESGDVRRRAGERLAGSDVQDLQRDVSVEQLPGTDTMVISARSGEPGTAARTATQYATAYAAARLDQLRSAVRTEAEEVSRSLALLQEQLDAVPDGDEDGAQAEALRTQYAELIGRQLELRASAQDQDPDDLVQPASVPVAPAGPGPLVLGALAALLTAAAGAVLVALLHRTRDPVEHRSDVEELDVPVVAEVPASGRSARHAQAEAAVRTAAGALAGRDPVPAVTAVLSADDRETGDVLASLAGALRDLGLRAGRARPEGGVDGDLADRREAGRMTLVDASSRHGAPGWLWSVRQADLVLVVVTRGVTRRAALAGTLAELDQVSSAPRLALLVPATGLRAPGDDSGPAAGADAGPRAGLDGDPVLDRQRPAPPAQEPAGAPAPAPTARRAGHVRPDQG